MRRGDGDGWVFCDAGHRHWGRFGAAGLLVIHRERVLLAHRAEWSHHGGTWGIPGGARDSDESARTAALRETAEETGLDTDAVDVVAQSVDDHGGWSYVTVHARLDVGADEDPPDLRPADLESTELRWTPLPEVTALALHPGFAAFWATQDLPSGT